MAGYAWSESRPMEPCVAVGFDLGPGWGSAGVGNGRLSGGQGVVFANRMWSRPWAYGFAAHFWWHSQDTTRVELTLAGPAVTWHARESGPLLRLAAGVGYRHDMLEFAQASTDRAQAGLGMAASAAWEFRLGTYLALGPELDVTQLWLGEGGAPAFWGGRSS